MKQGSKSRFRLATLFALAIAICVLAASCYVPPESSSSQIAGTLKVHFIDVGQGDAVLIQLPDSRNMLIDAGPTDAASTLVSYLKKAGVSKIDYLVFTHPHEDHIGGGKLVVSQFQIGKVYMPRASHTSSTYERLLEALDAKKLTVTEAKASRSIFSGQNLDAYFAGPAKSYDDLNNWSAVVVLRYGKTRFLFAGDAESLAEQDMIKAGTLKDVDVLKVGHHGSYTSTSKEFLSTVKPEYAVICVGKDNSYGDPHKVTLDKLKAQNVTVYRTDLNGTIVVSSNGEKLNITTTKK